ncbi:hypothetical protein ABXJ76_06775 [Methylobacter sp. G7]|uniref:hypothetical protein n=1 Tax=Methylobacter sp. G7 TaxID=3230117 RepID=UPI003D8052E9
MKMETISIEQLSNILEASAIISTSAHAGMLVHKITHPELGNATTVQGVDGGGLLFTK